MSGRLQGSREAAGREWTATCPPTPPGLDARSIHSLPPRFDPASPRRRSQGEDLTFAGHVYNESVKIVSIGFPACLMERIGFPDVGILTIAPRVGSIAWGTVWLVPIAYKARLEPVGLPESRSSRDRGHPCPRPVLVAPLVPGNSTDSRRILEKFCEFFEMTGYPRSSPNFSGPGADTAPRLAARTERRRRRGRHRVEAARGSTAGGRGQIGARRGTSAKHARRAGLATGDGRLSANRIFARIARPGMDAFHTSASRTRRET